MPNSIQTISKYLPLLDEKYKMESRTAILDTNPKLVRETADAKTILIARESVDGLGDYSRANGYPSGSANLAWDPYTFDVDRGIKLDIDAMDDQETFGLAFGALAGTLYRTQVVPEVDALRFAKYANGAGTMVKGTLSAADDTVAAIDTAMVAMQNKEVPLEDAVLFLTPESYNFVKNSSKFSRPLTPGQSPDRRFGSYDEMAVMRVPQTRFYTDITLYDGSSNFGFTKASASTFTATGDGSTKKFTITAKPSSLDSVKVDNTAVTAYTYNAATGEIEFTTAPTASKTIAIKYGTGKDINFMIVSKSAVAQVVKRANMKIFTPEENQTADGYKLLYRLYHGAWVFNNKTDGIYLHCKAAE